MREQLLHRPLLAALLGLICGLSLTFAWWPVVAVPVLLLFTRELRFGVIFCVLFGVGYVIRPPVPAGVFDPVQFSGEARIISVPEIRGDSTLAQVSVLGDRYRLLVDGDLLAKRGDVIRVDGVLGPLSEASGYGQGSRGSIRAERVRIVREGPFWWHWGSVGAASFRESTKNGLSERSAALVRGVCFNQTDSLLAEDWESFRRFGIVHLLSASGFHVVVVAGLLLGVLSLMPIPRIWQLALVFVGIGLFAVAAGFRPPIIRAVMMTMMALPAYAFGREADGISAVSLAGVANLILSPVAVVDLGFHLSMLSTLGLVMVITPQRWSDWSLGKKLVLPTLTASGASFPLLGFVFGEISLLGLIGNILVAPLVAVLIVLSILTWIIGLAVPPIGAILWQFVDLLAGVVLDGVNVVSALPGGMLSVPQYSIIGLVALYGLLVLGWRRYALD